MSDNLDHVFPADRHDAMLEIAGAFDSRNFKAGAGPVPELLRHFDAGEFHGDSAESYYTARMLEHIRAGVVEAQFPKLKASMLIPFDTSPDNGAESYTVEFETQVGEVRVSKDMRGIIPRVDLATSTSNYAIYSLLLSYGYTLQDVRAAMKAGKPLVARKAMLCREQIARKLDAIGFTGEAVTGLKGLLTLASTSTYTTPVGAKGSKSWTLKSPTEILIDMNGAPSKVTTDTLDIEEVNTMVLPLSAFENVSTVKVGDGTADTILTYFKRNNPHITQVETTHKSESNSGWTGRRMVCFDKNPLKLAMVVPTQFEQLMPDVTSTETVTKCHMRTAGVIAFAPLSVIYGDEI